MGNADEFYKKLNELVIKYTAREDAEKLIENQLPYKYVDFIKELEQLKKEFEVQYKSPPVYYGAGYK